MILDIDILKHRAAKDERLTPRHHAGTGFIQVYLKRGLRLHILHPDFPPTRKDSNIHNHRFSFHSQILLGCLKNTVYGLRGGDDHEVYEVYCGSKDAGEFRIVDPVKVGVCTVKRLGVQLLVAGNDYTCEIGEFHTSQGDGLTATLMQKLWEGHENSRVVVPTGTSMKSAFEDQPPAERLWAIIDSTINLVKESGQCPATTGSNQARGRR